jgi:hypothetical protein
VARETHPRGAPRVPRLTSRLREGAAGTAPTAPHATPPAAGERRTGPEKFWRNWPIRVALAVLFFASLVGHLSFVGWVALSDQGLEFHEMDGDLAIPVDLLNEEPVAPPPPPPEPPPPPAQATKPDPNAPGAHDAAAPRRRDAAVADASDAGVEEDAEVDADTNDGGVTDAGARDAEAFSDGALDAAPAPLSDAMVVASAEAGAPGARDPSALLGASGAALQTGPQNVQVVLNLQVIKTHPVGARIGPLLAGIPQWNEFVGGTGVDPIRDVDWIMIFGPSLAHTERDAVVLRYNLSDARAAKAIDLLSHKDISGGPFNAGVPGVKAWRGHADRADRVFLLPRPHIAAMVPPDFAHKAAVALSAGAFTPKVVPGEAVRASFNYPHGSATFVPEAIKDARVWVVPRADGGADLYGEGDCPDAAAAAEASDAMRRFVRSRNNFVVRAVSMNALDGLEFSSDGAIVKAHVKLDQAQLEALYELVAAQLGVRPPPIRTTPASPGTSSAPR